MRANITENDTDDTPTIPPWQVRDYTLALLKDLRKLTRNSGLNDLSIAIDDVLRRTK